ncbi:hypothetical protein [Streptomyces sp. NPDC051677]|uniref:hypothetical protein n=1 Tax=Streptomyces sp. NPDC051677 TaxID=3365669 RepID=UPI0037CFF011
MRAEHGGTRLFSAEQPELRRLVELTAPHWDPLVPRETGLDIGATCAVRDLHAFPPPDDWIAGLRPTSSASASSPP